MGNIPHLSGFQDSRSSEEEQDERVNPEMPSVNATIADINAFFFQIFQNIIANSTNKSTTPESTNSVGLMVKTATQIIGWGTLAVELPMLLLASYALARLIKTDSMAPVFVINLLATDLIQLIIRPAFMLNYIEASSIFLSLRTPIAAMNTTLASKTSAVVFYFALSAGNGFTLCIALERYLLVAHPLWYRCRRSLRHSLLASAVTWAAAGLSTLLQSQLAQERMIFYDAPNGELILDFGPCGDFCPLQSVLLLSPLPLLLFFLFRTRWALMGSLSVSALEQRKILGTLMLVLVNYSMLFLPSVTMLLISYTLNSPGYKDISQRPDQTMLESLDASALALIYISPLLDTLLYVFLRRDAKDSLVFPCLLWLIDHWTRDVRASASTDPQTSRTPGSKAQDDDTNDRN